MEAGARKVIETVSGKALVTTRLVDWPMISMGTGLGYIFVSDGSDEVTARIQTVIATIKEIMNKGINFPMDLSLDSIIPHVFVKLLHA